MTHCDIIIKLFDGVYLLANCCSDGYISNGVGGGVGDMLLTYYTNEYDIVDLITTGEFSPLCETAKDTKSDNMGFDNGITGYPVVLKDVDATEWDIVCGQDTYNGSPEQHRYLWKDGEWWYTTIGENTDNFLPWKLLKDAKIDKIYNQMLD